MRKYKINHLVSLYFIQQKNKENYLPIIEYKVFISTLPEFVVKKQIKIIIKILRKMNLNNLPFSYIEKIVCGCIKIVKKQRNN